MLKTEGLRVNKSMNVDSTGFQVHFIQEDNFYHGFLVKPDPSKRKLQHLSAEAYRRVRSCAMASTDKIFINLHYRN